MKIYISGPISGIDNGNKLAFLVAENRLLKQGHTVINPHKLNHEGHGQKWEDYMKVDIVALLDCDAIYMLSGWRMSRGARIENDLAVGLGYPIFYEEIDQIFLREEEEMP